MGTPQRQPTPIMEGLQIPDTRDLECQVLADLIENPNVMGDARGILTGDMFANEDFRIVWNTLIEMFDKGQTIDLNILSTKIEVNTFMALCSPTTFGLATETMDHCRALVEMATRRLMCVRAYEIAKMAQNPTTDFPKLLSMPGDLVSELAGQIRTGATTQPIGDVLKEWSEDLLDRSTGIVSRIPTGVPGLDKAVFGGWNGGNLIVMAARPSVGKSAVMLQMAVEAGRSGVPATVYSLEMPNIEMGQRLSLSTGIITQRDLADDATIKHLKWEKIKEVVKSFDGLPVFFNSRLRTMDEICNDIVMQHQRGRCSVAFIDHLHIISEPGSRASLYQQISDRTRRFKSLAMDCGIPIVLLCQLNRLSEADNRPPSLRDLRDSGSIEQDADIVLMLARHNNLRSDPDIDMWIRKNRQGKADCCIKLEGDTTRGFTVFHSRNEPLQ